jgi:hypothetical protein
MKDLNIVNAHLITYKGSVFIIDVLEVLTLRKLNGWFALSALLTVTFRLTVLH